MFKDLCKKVKGLSICNQELIAALVTAFVAIWIWCLTNAATFIATCAMIVTIWQGWISRKHNKLSVKPHLDYERHIRKDSPIILSIKNHGLGPAIIKSIIFNINGKKFNGTIIELLTEIKASGIGLTYNHEIISQNTAMNANEQHDLLTITNSHENDNYDKAIDVFKKISFTIIYQSLYEETFNLDYSFEK